MFINIKEMTLNRISTSGYSLPTFSFTLKVNCCFYVPGFSAAL